MTNISSASPPIGDLMQVLMAGVRRTIANPESATTADRALVAVTLVGIAIVIVWPKGRAAPAPLARAGQMARQVWDRRAWWLGQ